MERSDGRCLLCSICYVTLAPVSVSLSLQSVFFFQLSFSPSLSDTRSFIRVLSDSQVHANPPSYIQQTPSIYSFELDEVRKEKKREWVRGGKGSYSLRCYCVNFPEATPTAFLLNPASPSLFGRKPFLSHH